MHLKDAWEAAEKEAQSAGSCRVVWVDQASRVYADPEAEGVNPDAWCAGLKGDYPGAASWVVYLGEHGNE